jgi:hypothetical protein
VVLVSLCLLGGLGVGVVLGLFWARAIAEPFSITRKSDARLTAIYPDSQHHVLQYRNRDVGIIESKNGKMVEMIILSLDIKHQIALEEKDGMFPGTLRVETLDPATPYEALITVEDLDLDGVPDRKMDWKGRQLYDLESISWKPHQKKPDTKPGE